MKITKRLSSGEQVKKEQAKNNRLESTLIVFAYAYFVTY